MAKGKAAIAKQLTYQTPERGKGPVRGDQSLETSPQEKRQPVTPDFRKLVNYSQKIMGTGKRITGES